MWSAGLIEKFSHGFGVRKRPCRRSYHGREHACRMSKAVDKKAMPLRVIEHFQLQAGLGWAAMHA